MPARAHYSYESTTKNTKNTHTPNPLINTLTNESPSFPPHHNPLTSKHQNVPFVSIYGRETRLEQVLRLKTRPITASKDRMQAISREDKSEVMVREEPSRLQKIMVLKVPKPTVASTLINYHPKVVLRYKHQSFKSKARKIRIKINKIQYLMKDFGCVSRREAEAEERAERQWRQEERQREMELK